MSNNNMENNNKVKVISTNCVNSNWKARFLCDDNEECCQCSFGECKVKVAITWNGHTPYTYILTESEIDSAKRIVFGETYKIPQIENIQEALDKLTIFTPTKTDNQTEV